MLRRVTHRRYCLVRKQWYVTLMCGHVVHLPWEFHSPVVKGRYCGICAASARFNTHTSVSSIMPSLLKFSLPEEPPCKPA